MTIHHERHATMNVTQQLQKNASDLALDAALSVRKCFQRVLQTCLNAHGLGNDAALVGSTIKRKNFSDAQNLIGRLVAHQPHRIS